MRYPKKLEKGDFIATTAPSAGITKEVDFKRLDNAKKNIENLGNQHEQLPDVVEVLPGLMPKILKDDKGRSSSKKERAKQFMDVWNDDKVKAIISAGGGDFLSEVLDELDFNELRKTESKWFQGYSDNTVLVYLLTTILDTACIYY